MTVCVSLRLATRTSSWRCWRKHLPRSTGLCASTKSRTFQTGACKGKKTRALVPPPAALNVECCFHVLVFSFSFPLWGISPLLLLCRCVLLSPSSSHHHPSALAWLSVPPPFISFCCSKRKTFCSKQEKEGSEGKKRLMERNKRTGRRARARATKTRRRGGGGEGGEQEEEQEQEQEQEQEEQQVVCIRGVWRRESGSSCS